MLDNPFRPPTYNHDGSVAAAAAVQSYGGEQNVPLAMNQPAGGVLPSPNRNVLIAHMLFKTLAVFVYLVQMLTARADATPPRLLLPDRLTPAWPHSRKRGCSSAGCAYGLCILRRIAHAPPLSRRPPQTAGLWGTSYVLTFVLVTMLMAMGARAPRFVSARPLPSSFLRLCCCLSHYCCRCRADFWTVKNISGRLLVGLRWWNVVDDKGESKWHFQSFEDQRFVHPTDSNIFWLALFISPIVWGILAIGALLSFKFMWFLLVQVAFGLSVINAYGYVKCKRDASKKLQAFGGTVFTRGLQAYASMRSRSGGGGGSAPI